MARQRERMRPAQEVASISRQWVEDNYIFDPGLRFNPRSPCVPALQSVADKFTALFDSGPVPPGLTRPIATGPKREAVSRRNIECLTANLIRMRRKGRRTMSLSLRRNDYSGTKLSAGIINTVKLGVSRGALILWEGFRDQNDPKRSRRSRVKPTRRFRELLNSAIIRDDAFASEPVDLIGLRRTIGRGRNKRKQWVPRSEWEPTLDSDTAARLAGIRADLEWWNQVYGEFEFSYRPAAGGGRHFLFPGLYAKFTNDFDHGGRFYTGAGGHQSLTKAERRTIRFNGRRTVELDYSALREATGRRASFTVPVK